MSQSNVILASTIFDIKKENAWVDKNGSRTKPIEKNVVSAKSEQPRKKATSSYESTFHEYYY